jgi:hypothetical protein
MAARSLDTLIQEVEDFEIVDVPEVNTSSEHDATTCSNPFCQRSHVSFEVERASERAIESLIAIMQANAKAIETEGGPIFHANIVTDTPRDRNIMFECFTGSLPIQNRRAMNCYTCKQFLRKYGDLCTVADDGTLVPLAWPLQTTEVPEYYKEAVENVLKLFEDQEVRDEFKILKEKGRLLGKLKMGDKWNHMSVTLEKVPIHRLNDPMNSQDTETSYNMLDHTIQDHSPESIAQAHHMLCNDQLPYATSHKAPIKFLHGVIEKLGKAQVEGLNVSNRKNLITKYARTAFPGCLSALRGGMVGFLLDCITRGDTFEETKRAWTTKADPLSYMRPTAAPSVGNIESAEKIFARLGYTPNDLRRAFLTLDQVPESAILWRVPVPTELNDSKSSVTLVPEASDTIQKLFDRLLPAKNNTKATPIDFSGAPVKDISFRKFVSSVLPTTANLQLLPNSPIQPYFFTTGLDGSKPIMSFHNEGGHTASWYTWGSPAAPKLASLKNGEWTPVKAIVSFPHMWDEFTSASEALNENKAEAFKFKRHGIKFMFVLERVKDVGNNRSLCLFPTLMKGDFHSVRKTVEAFSNKGELEQPEKGKDHVGGFSIEKDGGKANFIVGVKTKEGQVSRYHITLFE